MSKEIEEVIESLDKNLKNLEEAEQINMIDVQTLLIDLFGVIKDLFVRFEFIFEQSEKIKELEKATDNEELYEEKADNEELKRLYL